ncbi:MAG: iron ABC transporter permease [Deltaproteobacteria bacterium]|nr:iron ABC transporter permease [Deltaproteobacteria bacterium]
MTKEPAVRLAILLLGLLMTVFIVYPLFKVIETSFASTDGIFVYQKLITDPVLRRPVLNSLLLGVIVSCISTLIGYFFAYLVGRTNLPGKFLFRGMATFPLIAPPFIVALSAIILLGRQGIITRLFEWDFSIYGFWGLLIVQSLHLFPLAYLVVLGALETIDPSIEEASINQGATGWQTFWYVTLPLSFPGLGSSMLLTFIESLADFGTPLILGGNYRVLSVESYLKIVGAEQDLSRGAALAILLLVPTLTAFFIQKFYLERKPYATVTGKPSTARIADVGRFPKIILAAIALLISSLTILFYGTVFYGSLTQIWGVNHALTLGHFLTTFREGADYVGNTFILAAIATPLDTLLGLTLAYLFVRKKFAGRGAMEIISMLTFAVPGTVIGIGYILAFNTKPLLLQGTWLIIVLLFIFRNMPVGVRAGIATLKQIDKGIEEAAHSLGASSLQVFRDITLPLLKPALFSSLAHSFIKCMVAISAVIFVVSGRWNLITIAILGYVETGELSQAAALCVFVMMVVSAVLVFLRIATRGRRREFVRN